MSSKNVFALNVGGQHYLTTLETLNQVSNSKLALWFKSNTVSNLATDQKVILIKIVHLNIVLLTN